LHKLLYGANMSIAGGLDKAIISGQSIGCTTIQLFTKSNRQWAASELTESEITLFKKTVQESNINPIIAHTAYLINIGSPKKDIELKSVESLALELNRCNKLSIPFLVLHPGAHLGTDEHKCLERIIENINNILYHHPGDTMLLLELMSGQGSTVCYTFEQLAYVYKNVKNQKRLGICLDTAHAWAAGYNFSSEGKYANFWQNFNDILGFESLKIIHINDSKTSLGSHIDRHENIGEGTIGIKAFKMLMNDDHLFDIPKILENPKKGVNDDLNNMNVLKKLLTPTTREKLNIKI
jgi:deoxyribonuclease IV